MAQIPLDNYGQATAVPRPNVSRVQGPDASGIARGAQAIASAFGNMAESAARIQAQREAEEAELARAKATTTLFDDELETSRVVDDIRRRVAGGELDWRESVEQYKTVQAERETPPPIGLDAAGIERFSGALRVNRNKGLLDVQRVADDARRTEYRAQFDSALDTLGKFAGSPGADMETIHRRAESFIPVAEAAGLDSATIAAKVQAFKDRTWLDHATGRAISARGDLKALSQLEHDLSADEGYYSGKLDTDRRNVLLNQVLGRKDQAERVVREAADRSEAKAGRAIEEFEQQISTGIMAPIEAMRGWQQQVEAGTPEQQTRFRELVDDEDELRQVRRMPPAEQRQYLQMLKAQQQSTGATAQQVGNLRRIETMIEGDQRRLRESPLEHDAILNGITVPMLDIQALASGNVGAVRAQFSERMATLARLRKQYGPETGNAPLLPQEASALSAALSQSGTRQAAQLFGTLNQVMGDPVVYGAAMQQIAPDSQVRAYAGRVYAWQREGGPQNGAITQQSRSAEFGDVAMLLLKGEALLNPSRDARGVDGKSSAFPMPPPQQFEQQVSAQVRQAFAGRPGEFDVAMQSVRAYYAAKSADAGDVSGNLDSGRLNQSIRAVIGERVRFEGRDVLPPWGMPADEFRDKAEEYVQARLKAAGVDNPGDVALMNLRGRDGGYMLVRGIDPIIDRNGLPLVVRIGPPR